jgi:hypothetical protein
VVKAVNKSETEIPVVWKTKPDVALRLIGTVGCRLLDQLIEETKNIAVNDQWGLNKIEVDYYDDPEVDWEYVMVVLDFGCPRAQAGRLFWDGFLKNVVGAIDEELEGVAKDIFLTKIHYDFESDS